MRSACARYGAGEHFIVRRIGGDAGNDNCRSDDGRERCVAVKDFGTIQRSRFELPGKLPVFLLIPRPLRDAVYDRIGKRRYRMFGKRDVCWKPEPELAERFLDAYR